MLSEVRFEGGKRLRVHSLQGFHSLFEHMRFEATFERGKRRREYMSNSQKVHLLSGQMLFEVRFEGGKRPSNTTQTIGRLNRC